LGGGAASADDVAYAKALAKELGFVVCTSDAHILRGPSIWGRLSATGHEASALVDSIMSKDCAVSASLTGKDNTKLLQIKQDAEEKFAPPATSNKEK
jgi:hypothetical protein